MAGLAILGCCERTPGEQISAAAAQALDAPDRTLRLPDVTAFEWDRVVVFGPMTSRNEMARTTGAREDALGVPASGVEPDKDHLVFLLGHDVVESVEVARRDVDFDCLSREPLRAVPWERATFAVREAGAGEHRRPVLLPGSGTCP